MLLTDLVGGYFALAFFDSILLGRPAGSGLAFCCADTLLLCSFRGTPFKVLLSWSLLLRLQHFLFAFISISWSGRPGDIPRKHNAFTRCVLVVARVTVFLWNKQYLGVE